MRPRSSLALRILPLLIVLVGAAAPAVSEQRKSQILAQAPSTVLELRRDVIILRSGTREQGVLTGCSGASCSLDGKSHRRDDIFLIGLGVISSDVPPLIEDPLQDSVHLRNASVLKARLLGINTQTVATAQGSRTRKDVSWVYLAPPQPSAPKSDARPHPPAKDKAKETRDAPRPAPPSGDETVKTAERWIGEAPDVEGHPDHLITSTAKIRLRVGDTELPTNCYTTGRRSM
jgi:hypothetical protein